MTKKSYQIAGQAAYDKKGMYIQVLNMENTSFMADYFMICSANSAKQAQSIADNVEEKMEEAGYKRYHTEGYKDGKWILLDFGEIIVHVFTHEERAFYDLESLWSDVDRITFKGE